MDSSASVPSPRLSSWGATTAAVLVAWAVGIVLLFVTQVDYDFARTAVGPDSYLRLFRVQSLWESGDWYDQFAERINAPFGYEMHWTRPLDLVLLLGAIPLAPFMGFDRALWVSGTALAPALFLISYLIFVWLVDPLLGRRGRILAVLVYLCQFAVLSKALPARVDQELLLLVCMLGLLGLAVRCLGDSEDRPTAFMAGMVAGAGVWLSVELLLGLLLVAGVLWGAWVREGEVRRAQNQAFAAGAVGVLLLAVLAERPPGRFLEVVYDKVSVVHLAAVGSLLLFWVCMKWLAEWTGLRTWRGRGAGGLLLGLSLLLALVALFPGLGGSLLVGDDPRLQALWVDKIEEFQGLGPTDEGGMGRFLIYLGSGFLALPTAVWLVGTRWREETWAAWVMIAGFCLVYGVLAVEHYRFAMFAQAVMAVPLAALLVVGVDWTIRIRSGLLRAGARIVGAGALLLGPFVMGVFFSVRSGRAQEVPPTGLPCEVDRLATVLEERWPENGTVNFIANLALGPEIVFRTPYSVVGDVTHRNRNGILDTIDFFSTRDESQAREVARSRSVDVVLVCLDPAERKFFLRDDGQPSLFDRLREGRAPDWLIPVVLPDDVAAMFRLYEVVDEAGPTPSRPAPGSAA